MKNHFKSQFFSYFQLGKFESINGLNLDITKYFVLVVSGLSQVFIILYHIVFRKDLEVYAKNKKKAGLIKALVVIFPIHFSKFQLGCIASAKRNEKDTLSK